ncbi:terminase small subunit [Enterococcus sp. AZ163]|uniref:terminase small subunit n=1 Tax=Enterococcus sp. AZ163 TaxID=2774638 RepID=UPI003D2A9661
MEKWELAYKDYQEGMKYKEIAAKHGVSINTVKSWKTRKWKEQEQNKGAPRKKKSVHTKQEKGAHKEQAQLVIENDGTEDITDVLEYYGINEQQRRFADNYIESANIYQSAIKAGYSESYSNSLGYKLLGNIGIKNYIDDRMRVLAHGKVATQQEILQGLTRIFNRQESEHQVVTLRSKEEKWVPVGEDKQLKKQTVETEEPKIVAYPTKVSDVIKAGESLLKRLDLLGNDEGSAGITIIDEWSGSDE